MTKKVKENWMGIQLFFFFLWKWEGSGRGSVEHLSVWTLHIQSYILVVIVFFVVISLHTADFAVQISSPFNIRMSTCWTVLNWCIFTTSFTLFRGEVFNSEWNLKLSRGRKFKLKEKMSCPFDKKLYFLQNWNSMVFYVIKVVWGCLFSQLLWSWRG